MKRLLAVFSCLVVWLLQMVGQTHKFETHVPVAQTVNDKTFALIVSNENYKHVEKVPFANSDGDLVALYAEKTLGIPAKNIHRVSDATLNDMNHELLWLTNVMDAYGGEARALVYYSGHGMPEENTAEAVLLPIDGYASDAASGLRLGKLYQTLGSMKSQATLVLLDACFSGAARDGSMLLKARGVERKPKMPGIPPSMVVFSAAQNDETAFPYKEKGHGLFTYYLLSKLFEERGSVDLGTLADYVTQQVKRASILENGKPQTPSVAAGNDVWRKWRWVEKKAASFEPLPKSSVTMAAQQVSASQGTIGATDGQTTAAEELNYEIGNYTIEGAGTAVQGSAFVNVTLMTKEAQVADDELLRHALHGVLFRGYNSTENRQHQRPLAGSPEAERKQAARYNSFFTSDFRNYGQVVPDTRRVEKVGKQYRVTASVSVMKDQLRRDLRLDDTSALTQGKMPTLMVVPAEAVRTDDDLVHVVAKIGELMAERGFPLKAMPANALTDGAQTAAAGADILLEVVWKLNRIGPKRSITFTLRGLDAYTSKQVASAGGTGKPSIATEVPVLLQDAVLEQIDAFQAQLTAHFNDLQANGREVSIAVTMEQGAKGLSLDSEIGGSQLSDIIDEWMAQHTVNHRYNLADANERAMTFPEVRIPLYADNGMAMDARRFATQLRQHLSQMGLQCKVQAQGLGQAQVIIQRRK